MNVKKIDLIILLISVCLCLKSSVSETLLSHTGVICFTISCLTLNSQLQFHEHCHFVVIFFMIPPLMTDKKWIEEVHSFFLSAHSLGYYSS